MYSAYGWRVLNNVWNPGPYTEGSDYTISSTYNPADLTAGTTFTWSFPMQETGVPMAVRAYPEVMFGRMPHLGGQNVTDPYDVLSVQLRDIDKLTADYDIGFSGYTAGFNVAYDIWLTSQPGGNQTTITHEIMIWLHKGGFNPGGTAIGTYSDSSFSGTIYYKAVSNNTNKSPYIAIVANADSPRGKIDLAAIMRMLQSMGLVSGNEYLADIELGAEVVYGAGSLTINNLDFDIKTKGLNGQAVGYNVSGAGAVRTSGGSGDSISYANALAAVNIDLALNNLPNVLNGLNGLASLSSLVAPLVPIRYLTGSAFNDTLKGDGVRPITLFGGAGNDFMQGGAGDDYFNGGANFDTVSYENALGGVRVDLSVTGPQQTYGAGIDQLVNVERLIGSRFNDTLMGDDIRGVSLSGGEGNDILRGGPGNDSFDGGPGNDIVTYANATAGVKVDLSIIGPQNTIGAGWDQFFNIEYLIGSPFDDILTGDGVRVANLSGGAGNDKLTGGANHDTLSGGTGYNVLDGRDGVDTVQFAGPRSSYTFTRNPSGSLLVSGNGESSLLRNMELLAFSDGTITIGQLPQAENDFNGDGDGDILFGNTNNQLMLWTMDAGQITGINPVQSAILPTTRLAGTGDFNGDGNTDILWQNTNGEAVIFLMSGSAKLFAGSITRTDGSVIKSPDGTAAWQVKGVGDFDGDGKADILWQNSYNQLQIWTMDGKTMTSNRWIGATPGAEWTIAGLGDFNGDGRDDIVWRSNTGQLQTWLMNGSTKLATGTTGSIGAAWQVKATADFNGDGKDDLLLGADNGQAGIWMMNGTAKTATGMVVNGAGTVINNPGPDWSTWRVMGVGDINADGKADILWQNDSGQVQAWTMDGHRQLAATNIGNPGSGWLVASAV